MLKKKKKLSYIGSIYVLLLLLFGLTTFLISKSLKVAESIKEGDYIYVSYEVLPNNTIPVIETIDKEITIIKPFTATDIKVGKKFYDYKGSEEDQKDAIVYYEGSYIQNFGIDYVKEEDFEVVAILDGEVISITEDDIAGKTIKIKHDNNLISVYQSVKDIKVKEKDKVKQTDIIALSGTNKVNEDLGNHLHFELIYSSKYVNPENYYNKSMKEFQ